VVKAPPCQAAYSSYAATTMYASGPAQARPPRQKLVSAIC
jgi:hypothetical protein